MASHGCSSEAVDHCRRLVLVQFASRLPARSPKFIWPPAQELLEVQAHLPQDLFGLGEESSFDTLTLEREEIGYHKTFLKALIGRIEHAIDDAVQHGAARDDWEVDPLLLEYYAELMAMPSTSSSGAASRDPLKALSSSLPLTGHALPSERTMSYYYPSPHADPPDSSSGRLTAGWNRVDLLESSALVGQGTTALKTWEASLRLAGHLLSNDEDRERILGDGSRVLELGSGTGFLTCLVAQMQSAVRSSARSFATDLPTIVAGKLKDTVELNGLGEAERLHLRTLDWVETAADNKSELSLLKEVKPTFIIGADLIFDPDLIPSLVTTIQSALQAGRGAIGERRPEALIASTVRNLSTYAKFLTAVERAGLDSEGVDLQRLSHRAPIAPAFPHSLPAIPIFPSSHDDGSQGVVRGLRIFLSDSS